MAPLSVRRRGAVLGGLSRPAPNAGLTLFAAADEPESLWLRLVLAEKDIEAAVVVTVTPGFPDEDFLILNPAGTLPTLADREGVIHDASVIAEYLDERYPHPSLMPLGPAPRARVRAWLRRFDSDLFRAMYRFRPGAPLPAVCTQALRDATRRFRERAAGGIADGPDFTLADCAWAVLLWRLRAVGAPLPQVPALTNYAERLLERPAVARVLAA